MSPISPLPRRGDGAAALESARVCVMDDVEEVMRKNEGVDEVDAEDADADAGAETRSPALARALAGTSPAGGSGLIKDALRVVTKKMKDGTSRTEIARVDEQLSFDKGFYLTIRAIQLLKASSPGRTIVVGVAGPSGAGKTVFTSKIQEFMPGAVTLSMDMYNDSSMLLEGNFDDPRLTDYACLLDNLKGLKNGETVQAPVYDYKESKRTGYVTVPCPASKVVILEGIYALNEKLRPMMDLRVSVTGGVHFDLVKRVLRDINRSGQAPESIIHQISETVYPMYKAFIEPDLRTAHLKVVNSFNPFAGFQDPTYILKSDRVPEESRIKAVLGKDCQVTDEVETADIYLLPPNEDPETCTSWLRMRNRDGHYTLMFAETVTDGPIMISPRIKFEVGVRILGGLMALGYVVGAIMKRRSKEFSDDLLTIKVDWVEGLDRSFVQVQGRLRSAVEEAGKKLGLNGTYIPHSYIEQVQLEQLTKELGSLTDDLKERFPITESMLTSNTEASDDSSGSSHSGRRRRSPGGSDSGGVGRPPHPPRRPASAAPANWGGYGLDGPGETAFYTPPPRPASRCAQRSSKHDAHDRVTSPSRRRTSPSGKSSRDQQGLEMKFDWLANRVEKLGELQRQASCEDVVATPGGSRVKESEMIAREVQALSTKLDSMMLSFHKLQLDVSRVESRQYVGVAVVGFIGVCAAFWAGAARRD
jgi:uridine kinase